jgi:hypothetical protein
MRSVRREPSFETQLRKLQQDEEAIDRFLLSVEDVLARDPKGFGQIVIDESPLSVWVFDTFSSSFMPQLQIFYSFTDSIVYLRGLRVVKPKRGTHLKLKE